MKYFDIQIRVAYADVDQMGVVYYGNYLVYFERGRTEMLRDMGLVYRDIEKNHKVYLPVREVHINYHAPVYYDDYITVRTTITELGKTSIFFSYQVFREATSILVEGSSVHVFINQHWKPIRIPIPIRHIIEKYCGFNHDKNV